MSARLRLVVATACAAGVFGCAAPSSGPPAAAGASPRAAPVTAERATQAVVAGRSTKAEVAAALGDTLAIRFHSGFEVWVYRLATGTPAAASGGHRASAEPTARGQSPEFVILFAPSGLAAKTRIRPRP